MSSPFWHGSPVAAAGFFNQRKTLRRLRGRLAKGQSTALIGAPHVGKTSLLTCLLSPAQQAEIAAGADAQLLFRYLDSHVFPNQLTQADFWAQALQPVVDQFPEGSVADNYQISKENGFGAFTLEELFKVLQEVGWRLVLLLDEFDHLLHHPVLNSSEFYGSLRSLASRHRSLSLVIATRRSLDVLNQETQEINPHGSPYFNTFSELRLGPFPYADVRRLLAQADGHLNKDDEGFILQVTGRHPYLVQLTADLLWHCHADGREGAVRYNIAANELYEQLGDHFADTWRAWSNGERIALAAVALHQIPGLVPNHTFNVAELIADIGDYGPELRKLKRSGIITQRNDGWEITQHVFLWWLADELLRVTREERELASWLQQQEYGSLLTGQEREKLSHAARQVSGLLSKGATTLIEAFTKGFGEGVGKAAAGG